MCHLRGLHYKNTPIQTYRKFRYQKLEIFRQKTLIFYSLKPPQWGGSNEYPQYMFLNRRKKHNVYTCKPQFYYIKVGFKGVKNI